MSWIKLHKFTQSPNRENVSIAGVRNSARFIENSANVFLRPVPSLQLSLDQQIDSAFDDLNFRVPAIAFDTPRSHFNLTGIRLLYPT